MLLGPIRPAVPPQPPIYQPEVAACAVLHAVGRPGRKQYVVGAGTWANRLAPADETLGSDHGAHCGGRGGHHGHRTQAGSSVPCGRRA
ncbi:hypothetical protein GCM10010349_73530 [Streptomyces flavofungini]|nr:hypothetical protein GCM10010349_73530 [Streptomyces flavofungini]